MRRNAGPLALLAAGLLLVAAAAFSVIVRGSAPVQAAAPVRMVPVTDDYLPGRIRLLTVRDEMTGREYLILATKTNVAICPMAAPSPEGD